MNLMRNNLRIIASIVSVIIGLSACVEEGGQFKSLYNIGETVVFNSTDFRADSLELRLISEKNEVLQPVSSLPFTFRLLPEMEGKTIGVYDKDSCLTFFRVAHEGALYSYDIEKSEYEGLPVYCLDGGMSPEFAVQKSLENLGGGISHTWKIGPGGGPAPVWSTFDFMERSIDKTISLYDELLGDNSVETVIIGTGTPLMSYLSAAEKAVFLPIQYLVSANSIAEIQTILEYSTKNTAPVYATLGYDASMKDVAVAWIKLLELPKQYIDFISRHNVKNVIVAGVGENAFGESFVRKVSSTGVEGEDYHDGSLYILYTQGGSEFDLKHIRSYITDYDESILEKGKMIADWESGVVQRQIDGVTASLASCENVDVWSLLAPKDMGAFYNFAMDVSMEFMQRNKALLQVSHYPSFVFNEYLISHPVYEMLMGYVPVLYWQFVPSKYTVDRMFSYGYDSAKKYFGRIPDDVYTRLNGRLFVDDMDVELKERGISNVVKRVSGVEELWDISDGMNAPCEEVAQDIVNNIGVSNYMDLVAKIKVLDIQDLVRLAGSVDGVEMRKWN